MVSIMVSEELFPEGNGSDGFIVRNLHLAVLYYHRGSA